jgi:ankyrin repeat protein
MRSLLFRKIPVAATYLGLTLAYQVRQPTDPFSFAFNLFTPEKPSSGKRASEIALIKAIQNNNSKKAKSLLEDGADPNEVDSDGNTAMHHAVMQTNSWNSLAELLLFNGGNPNLTNRDNKYPIDYHVDPNHGLKRADVQIKIDRMMLEYKARVALGKILGLRQRFGL